jgi:hypothetical protein
MALLDGAPNHACCHRSSCMKIFKKDPEESFARHDRESRTAENTEDLALKERIAAKKEADRIKKLAKEIEEGP